MTSDTTSNESRTPLYEELRASTDELLDILSDLAREATVRRITVRNRAGKTLFELPLMAGVAGAWVIGPWSAALLAGAWLTGVSILIEREPAAAEKQPEPEPAA